MLTSIIFIPGLYDACYQDVKTCMFSLMHLYLEDIQLPLEPDEMYMSYSMYPYHELKSDWRRAEEKHS